MQRRKGAESAFASLFYVESKTLFLVMSQFVSSINLQLSPDSISQGEQAGQTHHVNKTV